MEIKDAIRQRRQEKIRKIQEQSQRYSSRTPVQVQEPQPGSRGEASGHVEVEANSYQLKRVTSMLQENHPPERRALADADPEQMWKRKRGSWREWEQLPSGNVMLAAGGEAPPRQPGPDRWLLRKELMMKLVLSGLMFAGIWGMFHLDEPWALEGQQSVRQALTEDMNFEAVAVWYENTFSGSPAFIPIFSERQPPAEKVSGTLKEKVVAPVVDGAIVRSFAELLNGVEIAAADGQAVRAMQTGRVLLVSGDASGKTVVIQHGGKRLTIYSKLKETTVAQNDWVEGGDEIGRLQPAAGHSPSLLFFSVKEDEQYVDPADVVPLG